MGSSLISSAAASYAVFNVAGTAARKGSGGLWNFVGLAFQTCPSQCLRIARTAENHFLVPDQNYDVANLGRCMASDENLRGS
jgi:hypothetical protein